MSSSFDTALDIAWGWYKAEIYWTCVRLGIFEKLQGDPKTANEMAQLTQYHADNLMRLLRACAAAKLVNFDVATDKYSLNEVSTAVTGEGSMTPVILTMLSDFSRKALSCFDDAIISGAFPMQQAFGGDFFEYVKSHPTEAKIFDEFMTLVTKNSGEFGGKFKEIYPLDGCKRLVDVGGGHGSFAVGRLRENPLLQAVVFDTTVTGGRTVALRETEYNDVKDRLEVVCGDFFASVPTGGDIYSMKLIIHDWPDEKAVTILKNVHSAMLDNGKIIILDRVLDYTLPNQLFPTFLDIYIMLCFGGKERTAKEWQVLLDAGGFKIVKIIQGQPLAIIEAVKK